MTYKLFAALIISFGFATLSYALDIGNESMADKADHFDFEDFHKEKGITIWEEKKEKTTTTYDAPQKTEQRTSATKNDAVLNETFEKGDELKVREAYKLGNDPALRNIQNLYDAIEGLHKQLDRYCPNGWAKNKEWHLPEQNYFYIHYSAVCL